jgi:hypothetical protein
MHSLPSREKMRGTLKRINHQPPFRGGNGKPLPIPQEALMKALAEFSPVAEYVQRTGMGRHSGYPSHYKIDIAIPQIMLAIEVDGMSHSVISRQEQDKKKEELLSSLGWKVLRFTNRRITEELTSITSKLREIIITLQMAS